MKEKAKKLLKGAKRLFDQACIRMMPIFALFLLLVGIANLHTAVTEGWTLGVIFITTASFLLFSACTRETIKNALHEAIIDIIKKKEDDDDEPPELSH